MTATSESSLSWRGNRRVVCRRSGVRRASCREVLTKPIEFRDESAAKRACRPQAGVKSELLQLRRVSVTVQRAAHLNSTPVEASHSVSPVLRVGLCSSGGCEQIPERAHERSRQPAASATLPCRMRSDLAQTGQANRALLGLFSAACLLRAADCPRSQSCTRTPWR
jgi:hypothetical protein